MQRFGIQPDRHILQASANLKAMLAYYPPNLTRQWSGRAVERAVEIFRCPTELAPYGGFLKRQIYCQIREDDEWPDYLGKLSHRQRTCLGVGLVGSADKTISGWFKEKGGTPGRIRVLTKPPTPPVLDRPNIYLEFANSDYFSVRTITELSRIDRSSGCKRLIEAFPGRWAPPAGEVWNRLCAIPREYTGGYYLSDPRSVSLLAAC